MTLKECKITHQRANQLKGEYVNTRGRLLKQHLNLSRGGDDVSDVTFDLEILEQYIAYVKKEALNRGLTTNLGLRVHLGTYPQDDAIENFRKPGFSTVFFMPTSQTNNNRNRSKDEVIEGVSGLNMGHQGLPPNRIL